MRKLILILFLFISFVSKAQVYQEMPQYGYRANRMIFDSTLSIPSTCGVPTLRSNITKKAAIAFDSCNNRFYQYNPKTLTWSVISGTSIDTTSLSNRINAKADTSALNLKLNISDTANKWVNSVTKLNDSTIRVIKNNTTTDITLTPASTVTSATRLVTTVYNNTGLTITKGSVVYISGRHSSNIPTIALAQANDEANSYKTFALVENDITNNNSGIAIQAGNIGNLNLPTLTYTDGDILYLSPTVAGGYTTTKPLGPLHICKLGSVTRAHPTQGSIEIKIENGWELMELSDVQIPLVPNDSTLLQFSRVDSLWHSVSVTNAIGNKYLKPADSVSLSNRINLKLNISDSATMLSKYLRKTDTATLSNRINLKLNISDTASMLSNYQKSSTAVKYSDTTSIIGTKTNLALKLNISDSASMLSNYAKTNLVNTKVNISDTSSMLSNYAKTNLVNTKLNISDTSSMLTNYAKTNLVNTKINISDSASMLSPYLRKIDTTNKFVNNILRTAGKDSIIFYIGSTRYAIKDSTGAGSSYTFSTGLTNTSGTVTSNLSTGVSGGQSVVGGTAASNSLTLSSTSNATKGKILFGTSAYDEVNNRLGINNTSPSVPLQVEYSNNTYNRGITVRNTNTGTSVITGISLLDAGGTTRANFDFYPTNFINTAYANTVAFTSDAQSRIGFVANSNATGGVAQDIFFSTLGTNTTYQMQIKANGNVQIATNTDAGYKLDVNGTARVQGALNFNPTNTASGTTGNQTINKASGTVNIAAAGTTVTVTNSLVTASSIVFAVIRTNDATATIKNVVPAAGSFVINLNAATTAETSIGFFVIN